MPGVTRQDKKGPWRGCPLKEIQRFAREDSLKTIRSKTSTQKEGHDPKIGVPVIRTSRKTTT